MFKSKHSFLVLFGIGALAATAACSSDDGGDGSGSTARANYLIELSAGHTHVFKTYDVPISVRDLDGCSDPSDTSTCSGIPGLPLRVLRQPYGQAVEVQAMAPDVLVDNGDGTYTWTTLFDWFVPYMVQVEFEQGGNAYSQAFPLETSKAGGEAIFCPSLPDPVPEGWTPSYNYQVRWHASPGHIIADGETRVTFDLDLRRTIEVTNVDQPFRNSFDHLLPENLEIPEGGTEADKLVVEIIDKADPDAPLATYKFGTADTDVKYAGLGIYRVTHVFAPEEVGATKQLSLRVRFDDDAMNGTEPCPVVDEFDGEDHDDYSFTVFVH
jgi:hypothetical protein